MVDLRRQHAAMKPELDAALARVIESGHFMSGQETEAFEREFAAYCGSGDCVAVGSGTAALHLTLRALGVGPGDEVITVAFTLSATLDAILAAGGRPVLVDVDPATYTMDPSLIEGAVTRRTRAVLPVHIYGHPADMDAIGAVAERHGLPVVADACEAHGARYKGRDAASYGTASCFSFYPTKNLAAMGDGGGVVTSDARLAAGVRLLRQHGWDRRFHSAVTSMNSRMDELQAAVLRTKLRHLDDWNVRRRRTAARLDGALAGTGIKPPPRAAWAEPCYYIYVVLCEERQALRDFLAERGIASDVHWPEPPHLQPAFAGLGYGKGSLPVTERLCERVVTLPMFAELSDGEVERMASALREYGRRR
jgi:dTDP-4-amino-4,6-dideoxygalactose transaminase